MATKKAEVETAPRTPMTEEVYLKCRAGYPALYIITSEERRTWDEIALAASCDPERVRKLFVWTLGKGLIECDNKQAVYMPETDSADTVLKVLTDLKADKKPVIPERSIVLLRHFHQFLDVPIVQAMLLEVLHEYKSSKRTLIVTAPTNKMTPETRKVFDLIESKLPDESRLKIQLDGILNGMPEDKRPTPERCKEIIKAASGLTENEAQNAMTLSYVRGASKGLPLAELWSTELVMEEKCKAIRSGGLIEYTPALKHGMKDMGGVALLKNWVRKRRRSFTKEATDFGLPQPKGLLLVGIPGTGKTMAAKAIAAELGLPLLRCDTGRIYGSLVGESEANVREVQNVAEAIAPCILWFN